MFDASMVTCMTGCFETEFEIKIISLAILNNFLTVILMYFYYHIGLDCIL